MGKDIKTYVELFEKLKLYNADMETTTRCMVITARTTGDPDTDQTNIEKLLGALHDRPVLAAQMKGKSFPAVIVRDGEKIKGFDFQVKLPLSMVDEVVDALSR